MAGVQVTVEGWRATIQIPDARERQLIKTMRAKSEGPFHGTGKTIGHGT